MKKFEPEYIPYKKRVLGGISYTAVAALLITFFLFGSDTKYYVLFALSIVLLLLCWNLYILMRHSKKYLKMLLIGESHIEFIIVDRDNELNVVTSPLDDVRIKIFELFLSVHRVGRDFKLQIDVKQKGKFTTVFEQYQMGKWNKKLFDEVFVAYCEAKNVRHQKLSIQE